MLDAGSGGEVGERRVVLEGGQDRHQARVVGGGDVQRAGGEPVRHTVGPRGAGGGALEGGLEQGRRLGEPAALHGGEPREHPEAGPGGDLGGRQAADPRLEVVQLGRAGEVGAGERGDGVGGLRAGPRGQQVLHPAGRVGDRPGGGAVQRRDPRGVLDGEPAAQRRAEQVVVPQDRPAPPVVGHEHQRTEPGTGGGEQGRGVVAAGHRRADVGLQDVEDGGVEEEAPQVGGLVAEDLAVEVVVERLRRGAEQADTGHPAVGRRHHLAHALGGEAQPEVVVEQDRGALGRDAQVGVADLVQLPPGAQARRRHRRVAAGGDQQVQRGREVGDEVVEHRARVADRVQVVEHQEQRGRRGDDEVVDQHPDGAPRVRRGGQTGVEQLARAGAPALDQGVEGPDEELDDARRVVVELVEPQPRRATPGAFDHRGGERALPGAGRRDDRRHGDVVHGPRGPVQQVGVEHGVRDRGRAEELGPRHPVPPRRADEGDHVRDVVGTRCRAHRRIVPACDDRRAGDRRGAWSRG